MRRIIEKFCFRLNDDQFREIIYRLDPNNNGYISYKEFMDIFEEKESTVSDLTYAKVNLTLDTAFNSHSYSIFACFCSRLRSYRDFRLIFKYPSDLQQKILTATDSKNKYQAEIELYLRLSF